MDNNLNELYKVADWAAENLYEQVLKGAIAHIAETGVFPNDSFDQKIARKEIFKFLGEVNTLSYINDDGSEASFTVCDPDLLDKINSSFSALKISPMFTNDSNIPSEEWNAFHDLILYQFGYSILRKNLKLSTDVPGSIEELSLPTDFNFDDFQKELRSSLDSFSVYADNPDSHECKNEEKRLKDIADMFLLIRFPPKSRSRQAADKALRLFQIDLYKTMLACSLDLFKLNLTKFIRRVESQVLPAPALPDPTSISAGPVAQALAQPDWTLAQMAAKGPYAVTANQADEQLQQPPTSGSSSSSVTGRNPPTKAQSPAKMVGKRYGKSPKFAKPRTSSSASLVSPVPLVASQPDEDTEEESLHTNDVASKLSKKTPRSEQQDGADSTELSVPSAKKAATADPLIDALGGGVSPPAAKSSVGLRRKVPIATVARSGYRPLDLESCKPPSPVQVQPQQPPVPSDAEPPVAAMATTDNSSARAVDRPMHMTSSSSANDTNAVGTAGDGAKRSLIGPRPTAEVLAFEDSEEVAEPEPTVPVSSIQSPLAKHRLPKEIHVRHARADRPAAIVGAYPDVFVVDDRYDGSSVVQRRVKWSVAEEQALKSGIRRHGPGNWRAILNDKQFGAVLGNRDNVALKDKYRNLVKLGVHFEIPKDEQDDSSEMEHEELK